MEPPPFPPSPPFALFHPSLLLLHCCLFSSALLVCLLTVGESVKFLFTVEREEGSSEDSQAGIPRNTQTRQALGCAPTLLVLFDHNSPISTSILFRPAFIAPFVVLPIEERIGRLRVTVGAPSPFRRYRCWKMSLYQGEGWGEEEAERVVSPPS